MPTEARNVPIETENVKRSYQAPTLTFFGEAKKLIAAGGSKTTETGNATNKRL